MKLYLDQRVLRISFNRVDVKNSIYAPLNEDRIQTGPKTLKELWFCLGAEIGTSPKHRSKD